MKKIISVLLVALMILSLCACGAKEEPQPEAASNALTEILDKGFTMRGYSFDVDGGFKGLILKETAEFEYDYSEVYKVEMPLTQADCDALEAIPWDAEDADQQKIDYLSKLTDVTITDITHLVPTQADFDALVGKTFRDLEDMGFYNSGWVQEEEGQGYYFYYDGPIFYGKFTVPEDQKVTDIDSMSPNDIRALTVDTVEFLGLSFDVVYAE